MTVTGAGWSDWFDRGESVEIQSQKGQWVAARPDKQGGFTVQLKIDQNADPGSSWVTAVYGNGSGSSQTFTVTAPPVSLGGQTSQASAGVLNPDHGLAGSQATASGSNWRPGEDMQVLWSETGAVLGKTVIDNAGKFSVRITIPADARPGAHQVQFFAVQSRYFVVATFTVETPAPAAIVAVDRAFTTGGSATDKTGFKTGDQIWYVLSANVTNGPAHVRIRWHVTGPREIYDFANNDFALNSGYQAAYSPSTIPKDAPAGTYTLTVTLTFNGKTTTQSSTFTVVAPVVAWKYDAGSYAGKSGTVNVTPYSEPQGSQFANYCGPGATAVLLSAWMRNVPSIEKLGKEEHTVTSGQNPGTSASDIWTTVNEHIGQGHYSSLEANTQKEFSNELGRTILDTHHPVITSLVTKIDSTTYLNGWKDYKSVNHVVAIYGFDFTSPNGGTISYVETATSDAGTTMHGPQTISYDVFWRLVQKNNWQLAAGEKDK